MTTCRAMRVTMAVTCVAGWLSSAPATAAAQSTRAAQSDTVTRTPTTRWQFEQCMGGLSYGAPLKWALAYGMGFVRESEKRDWCFLGAAKVGFGGASVNVGLANSLGHWGSGTAVTAGVLRTFNDPMGATAKRTYVGGSVHLWPLLALGGEVGYYTRVGADPAGLSRGRGMVTWSTGFGF